MRFTVFRSYNRNKTTIYRYVLRYEDFSDYEIHDCQNKTIENRGKSKVIIIFSQEKNRMDVKKSNLPPIIQKTLTEK